MYPEFLLTALCWTVTYVLIIRRGFLDRTYGMPIVALCANVSWEFVFSVVRPQEGFQTIGYLLWLVFDLVILYTVLRFGPREFEHLPRPVFYGALAGTLVLTYLGVDLVSREFDNGNPILVGFGQNVMMSALFLGMLASRKSLRGQSVPIAAWKLVGTIFASLGYWRYGENAQSAVFVYLYVANAVLDLGYLVAVAVIRTRTRAVSAREPAETVSLGQ
jgi:hypothetical protein